MITQDTISFLIDLQHNNNKEWFDVNRGRYEIVKQSFEVFTAKVLKEILVFENWGPTEPKSCIFRINRDVRFSKNKAPYKNYFSSAFGNGGRHSGKIDYYLHIEPNNSFLGGGMWSPEPKKLALYRQEVDYAPENLLSILNDETFNIYFDKIEGKLMKRPPKGYDADHPNLDLLLRKELFVMHHFDNQQIMNDDFVDNVINGIKIMKPLVDYFNLIFE